MKEKPEIVVSRSGRKLLIVYRMVGQMFATAAQLRNGRTVVAETDDVPFGFYGRAREMALELAEKL